MKILTLCAVLGLFAGNAFAQSGQSNSKHPILTPESTTNPDTSRISPIGNHRAVLILNHQDDVYAFMAGLPATALIRNIIESYRSQYSEAEGMTDEQLVEKMLLEAEELQN